MKQTVFQFPEGYTLPPKGFFDCFPHFKTVYLSDDLVEAIEEGIFPARKMLLVIPEDYGKQVKNIPKEMAVAIHTGDFGIESDLLSHDVIFIWGKDDLEGYWDSSNTLVSGPAFQDPEYDTKGRWFQAVCRQDSGFSAKNITKISDYWKVTKSVSTDVEVILSESMLEDIRKKHEREDAINKKAKDLAIKIANDVENEWKRLTDTAPSYLEYTIDEDVEVIFDRLTKHLPALRISQNRNMIFVDVPK